MWRAEAGGSDSRQVRQGVLGPMKCAVKYINAFLMFQLQSIVYEWINIAYSIAYLGDCKAAHT
jgi:hypothetical protein